MKSTTLIACLIAMAVGGSARAQTEPATPVPAAEPALENMVAFGQMTEVSQNASMAGAGQSVKIGNLAVGWAPGIMLGWDLR